MPNKKINDIELREPQNNIEKALLGIICVEAERVHYGEISVDVKVHNGKITHINLTHSKRSVNLHNL